MTPEFLRALRAQILASEACAPHVHTNHMPTISGVEAAAKDGAIAAIISVGRTRVKPTEIGKGTIIEVLGLSNGNAFLDALDANPDLRHVKHLLTEGRLRLDSAMVTSMLAGLVQANQLPQQAADALLALTREPDPVTAGEVSRALRGPWGDEE